MQLEYMLSNRVKVLLKYRHYIEEFKICIVLLKLRAHIKSINFTTDSLSFQLYNRFLSLDFLVHDCLKFIWVKIKPAILQLDILSLKMFMNNLVELIADNNRLLFVRELKRSESLRKTFTCNKKFNSFKHSSNMKYSNFSEAKAHLNNRLVFAFHSFISDFDCTLNSSPRYY
jgi:hypothetical protein